MEYLDIQFIYDIVQNNFWVRFEDLEKYIWIDIYNIENHRMTDIFKNILELWEQTIISYDNFKEYSELTKILACHPTLGKVMCCKMYYRERFDILKFLREIVPPERKSKIVYETFSKEKKEFVEKKSSSLILFTDDMKDVNDLNFLQKMWFVENSENKENPYGLSNP